MSFWPWRQQSRHYLEHRFVAAGGAPAKEPAVPLVVLRLLLPERVLSLLSSQWRVDEQQPEPVAARWQRELAERVYPGIERTRVVQPWKEEACHSPRR